jgi:hypothetical protein
VFFGRIRARLFAFPFRSPRKWAFSRALSATGGGALAGCSWCESNDPAFVAKTADVVGLYVDPPVKTIVLCVDEKPWIQALQRAQGYLKLPNGRAYAPHGSCGVRSRIHRDRAGSSSAIRPPPHRSALWSHERSISRWIAHGDLNASNRIESLPMLVDWEYAQLADPVYDLACLSVY